MPAHDGTWIELANGFPPSLVTNAPADALEPNQTPEATGISATSEGYIVRSVVIPTGDTRTVKTYSDVDTPDDSVVAPAVPAKADYEWRYNRLWRIASASLIYGAPNYVNNYYQQGIGQIDFNEDATVATGALLAKVPVGSAGWALFKAKGGYVIPNATSASGDFPYPDLNQEMYISTATHVTEYNGVVYFCNADGVFSVDAGGKVTELSLPLRGNVPTAAAMLTDYQNGHITIGTTHLYDVLSKRWLQYDGTTFLFTTRKLRGEGQPLTVDRVAFEYDRTGSVDTELKFNFRYNERDYEPDDVTMPMPTTRGVDEWAQFNMRKDTGHTFQLKITTLPATIKLKRIWVSANIKTVESRGS